MIDPAAIDPVAAEWALIEPLIPPGKSDGGKGRANMREVVRVSVSTETAGHLNIGETSPLDTIDVPTLYFSAIAFAATVIYWL